MGLPNLPHGDETIVVSAYAVRIGGAGCVFPVPAVSDQGEDSKTQPDNQTIRQTADRQTEIALESLGLVWLAAW